MSVPNTNDFSLEDVRIELGLGATTGLVECFAAANASLFDPTYEGSKDELNDFRNYNAPANTFSIAPTSSSQTSAAFSFNITVTSNTTWSASDNAAWITLSPTSGSGNGVINVTGTANAGGTRFATVTVGTTSGLPAITQFCTIEQL